MSLTGTATPRIDTSSITTTNCNTTTDGPPWTMHLSVMDMRMNAYAFRVLYVFPPGSDHLEQHRNESKLNSTERLAQSFEQLLRDDYLFLVDGEMHVDPVTRLICFCTQHRGRTKKPLLEFDSVVFPKSTCDVLDSLDFSLAPSRDPQDLIALKCTSLRDGGFVIGLNVNHCVFDAEACFTFMNQWGMHYRHVEKAQRPAISHDRHLLCEQESDGEVRFAHPEYMVVGVSPEPEHGLLPKSVTEYPKTTQRVFCMSRQKLKHLKAYVTAGINCAGIVDPGYISTMDALTALMTVLITQARGHRRNVNVGTAVNGRRCLEPRLPANYAGNAVFTAFSSFKASELQCTINEQQQQHNLSAQLLATIAQRIRQSIHQQNSTYMYDTIAFLTAQLQRPSERVEASTKFLFGSDIMFSSWIGLRSFEANFDGARPLCVTSPALPVSDGMVVFQEESGGSRSLSAGAGDVPGGGVDVLVYLEIDAMAHLERLWSTAAVHCWAMSRV